MKPLCYDERSWQPEVLSQRKKTLNTVRKYVELDLLSVGERKHGLLTYNHPINMKLRSCTDYDEFLRVRFTAQEAAWLLCCTLNHMFVMALVVSPDDFCQTKAYKIIEQVASDNGMHYENELEDTNNLRICNPISKYFTHDGITIMDIALRLDELILEEWEHFEQEEKA